MYVQYLVVIVVDPCEGATLSPRCLKTSPVRASFSSSKRSLYFKNLPVVCEKKGWQWIDCVGTKGDAFVQKPDGNILVVGEETYAPVEGVQSHTKTVRCINVMTRKMKCASSVCRIAAAMFFFCAPRSLHTEKQSWMDGWTARKKETAAFFKG